MQRFTDYQKAVKAHETRSQFEECYLIVEYNEIGDELLGFMVCDYNETSNCCKITANNWSLLKHLGCNEARLIMFMTNKQPAFKTLDEMAVNSLSSSINPLSLDDTK